MNFAPFNELLFNGFSVRDAASGRPIWARLRAIVTRLGPSAVLGRATRLGADPAAATATRVGPDPARGYCLPDVPLAP